MDQRRILAERAKVIEQHGPWTAHDIALGPGVSTLDKGLQQQWRVDWFDRIIRRYGGGLFSRQAARALPPDLHRALFYRSRRILDLACLEGLFAIEFARMGAETVGLEIRDTHLAKARFAKDVIGLANCHLVQGDVRSIPPELGLFDVVICAGILYHLDFPDCVTFIRNLARRSTDIVLIDSHFAYDHITESVLPLSEMRTYEFEGQTYRGRQIVEHEAHVSAEEKAAVHLWASIDNDLSVWLDERDVVEIMQREGFRLTERAYPSADYQMRNPDRPTLVFKRGFA